MFSARKIVSQIDNAVLVLLMVGALFPSSARAAHPLITEDTGTQGRRKFQLELTVERGREEADGASEQTVATAAVLSYGLRDDTDMIFTLPHERLHTSDGGTETSASGPGDAGLDFKWRFFENDYLSLALKPGFTVPTGDEVKGLGTGKSSYGLYLITTIDSEPWAFHLHLGHIRNRNVVDERERIWHVSVGGWRTVNGNLKLAFDTGSAANTKKSFSTAPAFMILGLIYSPGDNFDLDLGIKKGLTGPETDYTLLGGVTVRF
jgi:hypothetical protein